MSSLDTHLERLFGGCDPAGHRFAALGDAHAVHESGYEVEYSRYSVTYRDAARETTLGAELDEDGVLVVHCRGCDEFQVLDRIGAALDFLGTRHARGA